MELTSDNWISILSILLSIVVAFLTAYFTIKQNFKKEKSKGKIILIELIKRYFSSCFNSWDLETSKMKKDNISKQQYLYEIERIEQDLLNLQNNLYYSSLLEKYPSITSINIQLSRDLVEQKLNKKFALNTATAVKFYELYGLVKKDMTKKYLSNEEFIKINKLVTSYVIAIKN